MSVVHQEVSAQGPGRVVVHAARAVGHIAHHHRLRVCEPAWRHNSEGHGWLPSPQPMSCLPSPWHATTGGPRAAIKPLAMHQRGRALATLRDVNMIKLESGNPSLQLGKAVCNSADYPLIKQYAASFLMLQRGEEQRETQRSASAAAPASQPWGPEPPGRAEQPPWHPQPCQPGWPSHCPRTPGHCEPVHPSPHPAASPAGASLAKLGVLQEQLVLRWHLARKSTERTLALSPIPAPASWRFSPAHPAPASQRRGTHWHRVAKPGLWYDLKAPPFWVFYCTILGDY